MATVRLRELMNGMGAPLGGKNYNLEQMLRVGRGGLLLLDVDTFIRDVENGYWINWLRRTMGSDFLIVGRIYWNSGWADPQRSERFMSLTPKQRAAEIVRRCTMHGHDLLHDPNFALCQSNEDDLMLEGHPEAAGGKLGDWVPVRVYKQLCNEYLETLKELEALVPDMCCAVVLLKWAGGHNAYDEATGTVMPDDYEYQYARPLIEWAKSREKLVNGKIHRRVFIGVHAYIHRDGYGWSPETDGYYYALRPLRPKGYREQVQGHWPMGQRANVSYELLNDETDEWETKHLFDVDENGLRDGLPGGQKRNITITKVLKEGRTDPGGVCEQYPDIPVLICEQNFWRCHINDEATAREGANKLEAVLSFYQRDPLQRIKKVFYFVWHGGDDHKENLIEPNGYMRSFMEQWPDYWSEREYIVGGSVVPPVVPPPGGETMPSAKLGTIEITDLRGSLATHPVERYETRDIGAIKRIVIHHSATSANATADAFARYHVTKGWPGIGYHFVVTAAGEIQYTADHTLVTYGVAGQNADTVHICLVGDFTDATPPTVQLDAARRLIDNYRLAMGQTYPVVGHRDIATDTACPGKTWSQWKGWLVDTAPVNETTDLRAQLDAANAKLAAIKAIVG
jgi:hypothetical protein